MGKKDYQKALFVILCFIFLFVLLTSNFAKGGDYERHFSKAKDNCNGSWFGESCESYTYLFHFLAKPFSFHPNAFYYFVLLLFGLVTPLIIFSNTKNWISVLFYFGITNYFYFFLDGIYPQGLAILFAFVLFFTKDWKKELFLLFLLIITHGQAFALGLLILFVKYFFLVFKDKIVFLCSGIFGNKEPALLNESIGYSGGNVLTVGDIAHFFFKIFPFPFLFFSIKQMLQEKKHDLLLLIILFFWIGLFNSPRTFYLIPLFCIPSLTKYYEGLTDNWRKIFFLIVIASLFFQLYSFINLKVLCHNVLDL